MFRIVSRYSYLYLIREKRRSVVGRISLLPRGVTMLARAASVLGDVQSLQELRVDLRRRDKARRTKMKRDKDHGGEGGRVKRRRSVGERNTQ